MELRLVKKILMFPLNIFIYAGKGVKYTFGSLFGKKKKTQQSINKLEGENLEKELQRVKEESDEFKRKANENNINVNSIEKPKKLTQF